MAASSATRLENSPIQQRIYEVLQDGKPHAGEELLPCIDDQATKRNLYPHIQALRGSLADGLEIVTVSIGWRKLAYQLVRTYSKPMATPGWQEIQVINPLSASS